MHVVNFGMCLEQSAEKMGFVCNTSGCLPEDGKGLSVSTSVDLHFLSEWEATVCLRVFCDVKR